MKKIFIFMAAIVAAMSVNAAVVWTGEHSTGTEWSALRLIPADYSLLADLEGGDVLVVTMTADAADARIMLQDGDWNDFTDFYNVYDAPSGAYAFVLNDADAAKITEKGVCVTGFNYTISQVEIFYHKEVVWTGSVSDNTGWAQSDPIVNSVFAGLQEGDLLGVEVSAINDGEAWHQYGVYVNWSACILSGLRSSAGINAHVLSAEVVDNLQNQTITISAQYLDVAQLHTYKSTKSGGTVAIDNTSVQKTSVKVLRDGVMYIQRGENLYNMQGQIVK